MSDQAIALVKDWGWLAGIAWLALMLLWSAAQPDELDRVRALSRLQAACVNLALRVNAMLSLNDFRLSNEAAIESNYAEFRSAVHAVVNALMDAAPRERHEEYWRVLIGAFADLKQFHSDKPVTASEMEKILDSIVAHARDRGRLPPSR